MIPSVKYSPSNSRPANANASLRSANGDEKTYSVLQLFVDPWQRRAARNLEGFLISKGIDLSDRLQILRESEIFNHQGVMNYDQPDAADAAKFRIAVKLKNILAFLFECNDDVNYTSEDGRTILHVYLANQESSYGGLTSRPMNINIDAYKHLYSFSRLTQRVGDCEEVFQMVKSLLDRGASLDAVDKSGRTPVHVAAETMKFELIERMLNWFSNVAARDEQGNTVLHSVIDSSCVDTFLDYREDNECSKIARILVSKGADLNTKNNEGLTPVQLAVLKYNIKLMLFFRENGGDYGVLTKNGENLVLLACKHSWLCDSEATIKYTIDFLVEQGCDVNVTDEDGYTPLHYAAQWDKAVASLVEYGADVDSQSNKERQTPLHRATLNLEEKRRGAFPRSKHIQKQAVKILLGAGAHWDAVDSRGRTPLHNVIEVGSVDMLGSFLEHFADVNDHYTSNLIMTGGSKFDNHEEFQNAVFKHGVKLRAVDFPVARVYERHVDAWMKRDERHYNDCVKEANEMKKCMISDGVSLYQFLHMSSRRQMELVAHLPYNLYLDRAFPLYHNLIETVCRDAAQRSQLLGPAMMAWYEITEVDLPDICVERILYFLNNWSLKAFTDAAST